MIKLALTIGPSGSGKSHWIADNLLDHIILCADDLRKIICLNESDQSKNHIVFDQLRNFSKILMQQNEDVGIIIANTNYNKKNRKDWIEIGKNFDAEITAYVFNTPLEVCYQRNKLRDRFVPEDVIKRQFDGFEAPTLEEGFDKIYEVDYLTGDVQAFKI